MTRARSLSKLSNPATFTVDTDNNVGVNSTSPKEKLNVVGVISATSFFGDGTGLTGVASTDNIVTGTAATFNNNVNVIGITTVGVLTAYTSVTVGTAITADAASGIVTATKFVGDGSGLTGVSGFATALSSDTSSILSKVFKTPINLEVAADATIQSDDASDNIAFMREGRIHVQDGVVLTVGSGTTVLMNILSIFP